MSMIPERFRPIFCTIFYAFRFFPEEVINAVTQIPWLFTIMGLDIKIVERRKLFSLRHKSEFVAGWLALLVGTL